jgi:peptidoglycan/LPS O-acetylase OafA/YrhL
MTTRSETQRLVEIDALRGVAALAVVLFHFTSRFAELFKPTSVPALSAPYGHYGVNLFFIISGFVIFMTLERTSKPMDFVVSRFSRLFPAYWVAIFLTFSITHLLGLPGKLVDFPIAICNLAMIHGLFHIPHVDDVYWTLEVELLFYCGMFALYRLHLLNRIHHALLALLALKLLYFGLAQWFGIDLPFIVFRLMILKFIPWFALGIAIYQTTRPDGLTSWQWPTVTSVSAVFALTVTESLFVGTLAVVLASIVWFAASGKLKLLRLRPFVWLGSISYPLYLLHENIGWSIQLQLGAAGVDVNLILLAALIASLLLADAIARFVERPAMRWIRTQYRKRSSMRN